MSQRHTKVLKLHILKPAGDMKWSELAELLKEVRYRTFRLANMAMSERYLDFHRFRTGQKNGYSRKSVSQLNVELRRLLEEEAKKQDKSVDFNRFSEKGALPSTITDALTQYKLRALTSKNKWSEVARGKSALPTFRLGMAIPVRCDKPYQRRLEQSSDGNVEVDLIICRQPYPRVVIATKGNSLSDGHKAILGRMLENKANSESGYRHRCFEIRRDDVSRKWYLLVAYDFPATAAERNSSIIVGADLGFSCPLYAAISNGHARLGRRQFSALIKRIRTLQGTVIKTRREIQRGGGTVTGDWSARSGHGRVRKLKPIERLEGKIDRAYSTLNHQLSAALVKFALDHNAGIIQIEDLSGLNENMSGSFLGERWRYAQLQQFIEYKAKEQGLEVRRVNPKYTSRRCSECGELNLDFTRERRDKKSRTGMSVRFKCPKCEFEADADYNAARNLSTVDIEKKINDTLKKLQISE